MEPIIAPGSIVQFSTLGVAGNLVILLHCVHKQAPSHGKKYTKSVLLSYRRGILTLCGASYRAVWRSA